MSGVYGHQGGPGDIDVEPTIAGTNEVIPDSRQTPRPAVRIDDASDVGSFVLDVDVARRRARRVRNHSNDSHDGETVARRIEAAARRAEELFRESEHSDGGGRLSEAVEEVVEENETGWVEDHEAGDSGALSFAVGQVLEKTGGSFSPREIHERLKSAVGGGDD